ncbi:MAG: aminodeoxychorismate synthase component I [Gemmatales bacterium]
MVNFEPVVVMLPGNLDPMHALEKLAHLPYVLFLDSARQHPELGRYSYLTADPWRTYRASGRQSIQKTLEEVEHDWDKLRQGPWPGLPPFQGGVAGLWGYGVQHALELLPQPRWNDFHIPDLVLGLYDWVIAFDHVENTVLLISQGMPAANACDRADTAELRAERIQRLLERTVTVPPRKLAVKSLEQLAPSFALPDHPQVLSNFTPTSFRQAIARGVAYTHAGDCFQVNLAQRLLAEFRDMPLSLYQRLRQTSPAQCAGYFDMGDFAVCSSSPERFIQLTAEGDLETRPIKGTRPRGLSPADDERLAMELGMSAKDHAENVMIVDLLRNDLGRVAEYGSVNVPELCRLESNASVHHLVSVVRAKLRHGMTPFDVLRATLPGGSVTGAPKVRAMEIIAELEPTTRGPYCGCLGYISLSGAMDTNILIRTMTVGQGWVQFPVGGGIVADSDPDAEYAETLDKAKGMLKALQISRPA